MLGRELFRPPSYMVSFTFTLSRKLHTCTQFSYLAKQTLSSAALTATAQVAHGSRELLQSCKQRNAVSLWKWQLRATEPLFTLALRHFKEHVPCMMCKGLKEVFSVNRTDTVKWILAVTVNCLRALSGSSQTHKILNYFISWITITLKPDARFTLKFTYQYVISPVTVAAPVLSGERCKQSNSVICYCVVIMRVVITE